MCDVLKQVAVIVSKCAGRDNEVRTYGDRLVDERLSNVEDAMALGDKHRAEGVSVLIRPTYNEVDENGRFFREWRSFHGSEYKEVRWSY